MKIRRYQYGQSNVSRLQEKRGKMVSPGTLAEAAAAPYEAVAQATGEAANVFAQFAQDRRQTAAKTAATDAALQTSYMTNAIENLPEEARKEGWTAEQYRQNADAVLSAYEDSLNAIEPEFREELRGSWNMNKAMYAQQLADSAIAYEDEIRLNKMNVAWAQAFDAKDVPQLKLLHDVGVESGDIDEIKSLELKGKIQALEQQNMVDGLYESWRDSPDPDAVHNAILNDKEMDADVRDATIKRIEAEINNRETLERQAIKKAAIAYERQVTDLLVRAKNGEDITDMIEPLISEIDSVGSDVLSDKGSGWRQSLYFATVQGMKTQVDNSVYARSLAAGPGATVNSAENRKSLQAYAQEVIPPGATADQAIAIENNLTRVAGYPPQNVQQQLKAAGNGLNAGALVRAATRVLEITDGDPYTGVDLGLESSEMVNVMRVANAILAQEDPLVSAEAVVAYNKKWRDDRVVANALQKQAGNIDTDDMFTDLVDEAYDGIFRWEAEMTESELATAKIRFDQYFRESYIMADGDEQAARVAAAMRFQQTHAETYINGEAELQFNGIRAGSEELGNSLFENDLLGNTYIGLDETGSSVVTIKDRDKIKFRNPRIVDGKQEYQVFYNEMPMFSDDDQYGRRAVFVRVDEEAELQVQQAADAEEIKAIREEIEDLEAELRKAERMKENIYVGPEMREKARDIPKQIAYLQQKIRRIQ